MIEYFVTLLIGFFFGWVAARASLALLSDEQFSDVASARNDTRELLGRD